MPTTSSIDLGGVTAAILTTLRVGPFPMPIVALLAHEDGLMPGGVPVVELDVLRPYLPLPWVRSAIEDVVSAKAWGIFQPAGPFVFLDADMPVTRWRQVLTHELGHACLYYIGAPQGEADANILAELILGCNPSLPLQPLVTRALTRKEPK